MNSMQIPRLALMAVLLLASAADATAYDLVIRNGRIVDGTGNPAFFADVAVEDGRIARVGRVRGKGRREIDARGLTVAPGFIDVHTHVEDLASHPRAENFARMGVTTLVTGNCGTSALDVGKALRAWQRAGTAVNVATLIGPRNSFGGSHHIVTAACLSDTLQCAYSADDHHPAPRRPRLAGNPRRLPAGAASRLTRMLPRR
jgi:dihydroorotase-like cyclic amidohydrolase